jgi:hypothetical protein
MLLFAAGKVTFTAIAFRDKGKLNCSVITEKHGGPMECKKKKERGF